MPPDVWVLIPLGGMATGALFLVGIYKLVNRWLELRHRRDLPAGGTEELRHLEERVTFLEEQSGRVQELEERLDFAERMLAKQGQRPLLGDH